MYVLEDSVKTYIKSILSLMDNTELSDLNKVHANMCMLESSLNDLNFYLEVVNSNHLMNLLEDVRCLIEYYLLNRYIVLSNRKLKKEVSKRVKKINDDILSLTLDDSTLNINYIKGKTYTMLKEVYEGTDIRVYGTVIERYTKLSNNLKALSNIVDSIDIIDEELHFLDTFLDSKFMYLGLNKHRGNLKRIAESLIKDIS